MEYRSPEAVDVLRTRDKCDRQEGSTSGAAVVILVTMTTVLSLAEVKTHLSELVRRVNTQHERVSVTVHGKPSAVLIATDDLQSLEESIAILSDPDTMQRLAASDAELAQGEGESEAELAQAMTERRRRSA
ncbi:type II toxin-antitoxin system Phd/YefM family antitoxin [Tessaracoccus defluvii]|uniref:Antitoxin n=2 Tax=Tessaracoccus defluvii TaxID=1285901 RepID=A0A7H0H5X1_9ACTN|nr:type II toxin-antitoxin system Phd/YefM family antitoxin [Tessaracoccus defluvii]